MWSKWDDFMYWLYALEYKRPVVFEILYYTSAILFGLILATMVVPLILWLKQ